MDKIKGVATNFLHYWNGTNWINSGVEWLKSGFLKVTSIVLSTNSGTALPNELGTDGSNVVFGATKRKLAYDEQTIKTINSDSTLDDSYHNCIVRVTANAIITIPQGLREDFNCVFDSIGSVTGTFTEGSGITFSAPFGKLLKNNSMCTLYKTSSGNFRLNGGLLPV